MLPSPEPEWSCKLLTRSISPSAIVTSSLLSVLPKMRKGLGGYGRGSEGREGSFGHQEEEVFLVSGGLSLDGVGPQRASSSATACL